MKKMFGTFKWIAALGVLLVMAGRGAAADFQSNTVTSGAGNVVFTRSATDTNGNIYTTGFYQNTFSYGGLSAPTLAAGITNFFLLKTDPAGNALWLTSSISSTFPFVQGTAIAVDTAGDVFVGLQLTNGTSSTATIDFSQTSGFHLLSSSSFSVVAKYNQSTGAFQTAHYHATNSVIYGLAITADNASVIASGSFRGIGVFEGHTVGAQPSGADNMFLVKHDIFGNTIWVTEAPCASGGYSEGTALALDSSGNIYTTGTFGGTVFSGKPYQLTAYTNNPANSSAFIVKWTNSTTASAPATPQWAIASTDTSNSFTSANDLAVDVNSNLYVSFSLSRTDPNSTNALGLNISGTGASGVTHYAQTNGGASEGSVVKLDSGGNILWGQGTLGAAGSTNSNTRITVTSNYVYSLGTFGPGPLNFPGVATLGTPGGSFLMQLGNPTGQLSFVERIGTNNAMPTLLPLDVTASSGSSGETWNLVGSLGSNSFITQHTIAPPPHLIGYVNISIPTGGSLIGNPLFPLSIPQTVSTIFPVSTNFLEMEKPLNGVFAGNCYTPGLGWYNPEMTLNYAEGCFVTNNGPQMFTTFIGSQVSGTIMPLSPGLSLVTSLNNYPTLTPVPLPLNAVANADTVSLMTNSQYDVIEYRGGQGWFDPAVVNGGPTNGPPLNIGQSFVFSNSGPAVIVTNLNADAGIQTNLSITPGTLPANAPTLFAAPLLPAFQGVQLVKAPGANFSLSTASGSGVSFQWQRNGVNLTNDTQVSGATSSVLTVVNVQAGLNDGTYAVVVTNPYGSTGALIATVQIQVPPQAAFSGLTASQSITYGTTGITLAGKVSAAGPNYPAAGEAVSVTIAGHTQTTTINDSTGDFSLAFNSAILGATTSADVITYTYASGGLLGAVTNSSTALTVNPLPVNLAGTRPFDGNNDAPASILSFTTNYDGANLTLSGSALLAGSAVGAEAIANFSGLTLGGTAATNYTLAGASGSVLVTAASSLIFATNNGTVTVTGYSGPGGAIIIPAIVNGLPVTGIGVQAFNNNTTITSLYISNGAANLNIADAAFDNCSALTNVFIPNSVTNLGNSAFAGCTSLTTVTGGSNVMSLGGSVFNGDGVLSVFNLSTNLASAGTFAFFNCVALTNLVIPATLTQLSDFMFDDCPGLTNVTLPNTLTSIGNSTFAFCGGLKSIAIPNSVTNIADDAFAQDTALTNIFIAGNPIPLGGPNVFAGINPATGFVYYPASATGWPSTYDGLTALAQVPFSYTVNGNAVTVGAYTGSGGAVTIPGFINGVPVSAIANNAFNGATNVTSVTLPASLTSIGDLAFDGCTNLASINLPDGVTNIGIGAFLACSSLANITLPTNLTSIAFAAFDSCSSLTSIAIPNRLASIGQNAFTGDSALTNVSFGTGVTNIGDYAFDYCGSLTSLTIPASVTAIGQGSFIGCTNLTSMFFPGNAPTMTSDAFSGDSHATIYRGAQATGWGVFATETSVPVVIYNPQAGTFTVSNNQFGFTITGRSNTPVVVEASTSVSGPWSALQTFTLTNGAVNFIDPQSTSNPGRYYRFRSP